MAVQSRMLELGTPLPRFSLPAIDGGTVSGSSSDSGSRQVVSTDDLADARALLVAFLCNHCPYVRHVEEGVAALARDYQPRGVAVVGICSNDTEAYPDDRPEGLAEQAERAGFTFPYLVDTSQEVAQAFHAACTPDFFLFGPDRRLVYRGELDGARPGNDEPVTGASLRAALDAVLAGQEVPGEQQPSMGCSIKWKPGNAPT